MRALALVIAGGQGIMAGLWLEEVGISVVGSIGVAVAVAHSWYLLLRGRV